MISNHCRNVLFPPSKIHLFCFPLMENQTASSSRPASHNPLSCNKPFGNPWPTVPVSYVIDLELYQPQSHVYNPANICNQCSKFKQPLVMQWDCAQLVKVYVCECVLGGGEPCCPAAGRGVSSRDKGTSHVQGSLPCYHGNSAFCDVCLKKGSSGST